MARVQIFSVAPLPGFEIVVLPLKTDKHSARLRLRENGRDVAESMVPLGCDVMSFVAGMLEGIAYHATRRGEKALLPSAEAHTV